MKHLLKKDLISYCDKPITLDNCVCQEDFKTISAENVCKTCIKLLALELAKECIGITKKLKIKKSKK